VVGSSSNVLSDVAGGKRQLPLALNPLVIFVFGQGERTQREFMALSGTDNGTLMCKGTMPGAGRKGCEIVNEPVVGEPRVGRRGAPVRWSCIQPTSTPL